MLVAVASERGARRRHRSCIRSLDGRDGEQRDQRESGNEFPHDTSPYDEALSWCLQRRRDELPMCVADTPEMGLCTDADKLYFGIDSITKCDEAIILWFRFIRPRGWRAAVSRMPDGRLGSMLSLQAEMLLANLSVAVVSECGARRRHKGRVRTLDGRDGEQRDQRDRGNEFLHDTSP
jgi:hypothetical protein